MSYEISHSNIIQIIIIIKLEVNFSAKSSNNNSITVNIYMPISKITKSIK